MPWTALDFVNNPVNESDKLDAMSQALSNVFTIAEAGGGGGGGAALPVFDLGNSGTAKTVDVGNGSVQKVALTGNCAFTFTGGTTGIEYKITLYITQGTPAKSISVVNGVQGQLSSPTIDGTNLSVNVVEFTTINAWAKVRWGVVDVYAS